MNAEELAEAVQDLLRSASEDDESDADELHGAKLKSFGRAGLLTRDAGFVVELADGAEYQVTITQSRVGHGVLCGVLCEECGRQIGAGEVAAYRREVGDPTAEPAVCEDCAEDEDAP